MVLVSERYWETSSVPGAYPRFSARFYVFQQFSTIVRPKGDNSKGVRARVLGEMIHES
jgi:hypothetical protein